jgi:type I restriction enzyme M protein
MLGAIYRKAQNHITNPAMLRRLVAELIGRETWSALSADVKGDAYEGLLEKNAQESKKGAGQYFTPRPVIRAMIEVMRPTPRDTICDPACGTGGFLFLAHDHILRNFPHMTRGEKRRLRLDVIRGNDIVDENVRRCAMNLYLHGIGPTADEPDATVPVEKRDSLATTPAARFTMVLTNPPFGKKSSVKMQTEEGDDDDDLVVVRDDFWTTTKNKQLNFVQHIVSLLEIHGRAAVVLPDNVLFEGGAGETVRRRLMETCDLHTILRLPTGIFYAQGVKANVLFFDRKPAAETAWTKEVWFYDLRTNGHFTLVQNRLADADLKEFVELYKPGDRPSRVATWTPETPTGRWRRYTHEEILQRDKCSLDIFWLRDESLDDPNNLPPPEVIAAEIVEDLETALDEIRQIAADLVRARG